MVNVTSIPKGREVRSGVVARGWRRCVLVAMLAVAGCATGLEARVTSFNDGSPELSGATFAFRPSAAQRDSLEYRRYESLVRQALVAHGLREVSPARLAVSFDYDVRPSTAVVSHGGTSVFSSVGFGIGGGGGFGGIGIGVPIGTPAPAVATLAEHRLHLQIDRTRESGAGTEAPRLFEGTASVDAPRVDMPALLPRLVEALFQDFPGTSGVTRVVRLPDERR